MAAGFVILAGFSLLIVRYAVCENPETELSVTQKAISHEIVRPKGGSLEYAAAPAKDIAGQERTIKETQVVPGASCPVPPPPKETKKQKPKPCPT